MIIGITGYKGSGKDTAGLALIRKGFWDEKLATALKQMLRAMYQVAGYPEEEIWRKLEGDLKEVPCDLLGGKTPRWAMQSLGTEWRNMICEDLWVRIWTNRVLKRVTDGTDVVCTDIRFGFEADALKAMGGILIRVHRPGLAFDINHASEAGIGALQADYEVINNGTVEDLHAKIWKIL